MKETIDYKNAAQVGLWLFLAVATMLFASLLSAYIVRMGAADWRSLPKPGLLWFNTGVLLISSAALHWADSALRQGQRRTARLWTTVGAIAAGLFIIGQITAWYLLYSLGYFLHTNPSSSFFYVLTAVHGVHLIGGLAVAAATVRDRERFRLFLTYWHFLTVVWLVLFVMIVLT